MDKFLKVVTSKFFTKIIIEMLSFNIYGSK